MWPIISSRTASCTCANSLVHLRVEREQRLGARQREQTARLRSGRGRGGAFHSRNGKARWKPMLKFLIEIFNRKQHTCMRADTQEVKRHRPMETTRRQFCKSCRRLGDAFRRGACPDFQLALADDPAQSVKTPTKEDAMTFTLPPPALQKKRPGAAYLSQHAVVPITVKHHQAYVDNLNKLVKDTPCWQARSWKMSSWNHPKIRPR